MTQAGLRRLRVEARDTLILTVKDSEMVVRKKISFMLLVCQRDGQLGIQDRFIDAFKVEYRVLFWRGTTPIIPWII